MRYTNKQIRQVLMLIGLTFLLSGFGLLFASLKIGFVPISVGALLFGYSLGIKTNNNGKV